MAVTTRPTVNVEQGQQYVYDVGTLSWVRMVQPVISTDTLNVNLANPLPVSVSGSVAVTGTFFQATQPVSAASLPLPSGASTLAEQQTQTGKLPGKASTGTTSSVADSASNVTLLSANANRLGATIQNTSSAVLYAKFGATATSADFTVRMAQYDYYEVPYWYTGRIDGIWASDPGDGAAKITELTA